MKKSIIIIVLAICILINFIPLQVLATDKLEDESIKKENYIDIGAYTIGNNITVDRLLEQSKFTARQGHGFAAELGNNFIDQLKGIDAKIVGNDNVKNGADRLITGKNGTRIWIQDKYYKTAKESIDACFEDKAFRYLDGAGNAMQIEVPSDQYDAAVEVMRKKIENGQLKNAGITDPDDAENIVRKGSLTYKQAVNLAKAGTVESLKFDAERGIVSAGCAFGISTLIVYSVSRLNGESLEDSMKIALAEGLKTGEIVFGAYVISSQLSRIAVVKRIIPSTGVLTAGVTIILLTVNDIVEIIRGRISVEQLLKNLAVTTAGFAGGYAGGVIGGAVGTAVVPGAGTTVGTIAGTAVGGAAAAYGTEKVLGIFVRDDAEKMMEIIENNFLQLAQEYILREDEANRVSDALQEQLEGENLKNMFASEDQNEYAKEIIEPLIVKEVASREKIKIPTETEMRAELKSSLKGVVLVH